MQSLVEATWATGCSYICSPGDQLFCISPARTTLTSKSRGTRTGTVSEVPPDDETAFVALTLCLHWPVESQRDQQQAGRHTGHRNLSGSLKSTRVRRSHDRDTGGCPNADPIRNVGPRMTHCPGVMASQPMQPHPRLLPTLFRGSWCRENMLWHTVFLEDSPTLCILRDIHDRCICHRSFYVLLFDSDSDVVQSRRP